MYMCVQLSAPIVGLWQHEGGWLKRVLLSSQPMDEVSFSSHAPQLMLVHYNSQYYLQAAATSHKSLVVGNSLGEIPGMKADTCTGHMGQMREVPPAS